jgi:hypothetical protein
MMNGDDQVQPSARLRELARGVQLLLPDRRDPHLFHEQKSEIVADLRNLARATWASLSAGRCWITGCRARTICRPLRLRSSRCCRRPNPFGIKAGGGGGCTPALAVFVSAILDALAPLGVRDITMPPTPRQNRRRPRGEATTGAVVG